MKIHQNTFFAFLFFCKLVDGQECSSSSSEECIAEEINISTKTISHEECMQKMKDGECNTNMSFMFQNCSAECIRDSNYGKKNLLQKRIWICIKRGERISQWYLENLLIMVLNWIQWFMMTYLLWEIQYLALHLIVIHISWRNKGW